MIHPRPIKAPGHCQACTAPVVLKASSDQYPSGTRLTIESRCACGNVVIEHLLQFHPWTEIEMTKQLIHYARTNHFDRTPEHAQANTTPDNEADIAISSHLGGAGTPAS